PHRPDLGRGRARPLERQARPPRLQRSARGPAGRLGGRELLDRNEQTTGASSSHAEPPAPPRPSRDARQRGPPVFDKPLYYAPPPAPRRNAGGPSCQFTARHLRDGGP